MWCAGQHEQENPVSPAEVWYATKRFGCASEEHHCPLGGLCRAQHKDVSKLEEPHVCTFRLAKESQNTLTRMPFDQQPAFLSAFPSGFLADFQKKTHHETSRNRGPSRRRHRGRRHLQQGSLYSPFWRITFFAHLR